MANNNTHLKASIEIFSFFFQEMEYENSVVPAAYHTVDTSKSS